MSPPGPVRRGQAPGQSASVTLYLLAYAQPSDVAARTAVEAGTSAWQNGTMFRI